LTLSASGTYLELMSFVKAISAVPRALVVDSLSISGTTQITASINARIFYAGSPTP
jgi:Tfp pilus assembly protein PilO